MTGALGSYRTFARAAAVGTLVWAAAAVAAALAWPGGLGVASSVVCSVIGAACALLAAAGWIVLRRATADAEGRPDLYLAAQGMIPTAREAAEAPARSCSVGQRLRRRFAPGWIRAGDWVRVRDPDDIERTLDADGRLEGLPFMAEMRPSCGRVVRVHRVIDKVYDYGRTKRLKRMRRTVSLAGLRCDGSAHGGCEAACYIFWKIAWLRHASDEELTSARDAAAAHGDSTRVARNPAPEAQYVCQFTCLAAASTHVRRQGLRADLVPLLAGNVRPGAFVVALLTRAFNGLQRRRGGVTYPAFAHGTCEQTPHQVLNLESGDVVRVASAEEIRRTLNRRGRNRGLWFDREMLKHCGREYRVLKRVHRIIDDVTGCMVEMKTPCIVLRDVVASGEFHRFLAQEEYLYWREIWLERAGREDAGRSPDQGEGRAAGR